MTALLGEDHKKVKGLFEEFKQAGDAKPKQRIVEPASIELEIHSKLEDGMEKPGDEPPSTSPKLKRLCPTAERRLGISHRLSPRALIADCDRHCRDWYLVARV